MKRLLAPLLMFIALVAVAQEAQGPLLPADPAQVLGYNPAQLIEAYGSPLRVFSIRGAEPWQDDVVFDYQSFSAFIFMDRVWQLRISADYPEPILGFPPSASLERIEASLGLPIALEPGNFEWALPGRGWPVRLRAINDENGIVKELYLYRADF